MGKIKRYCPIIILSMIMCINLYASNVEWVKYEQSIGIKRDALGRSNHRHSIFQFYRVGDIRDGLIRISSRGVGLNPEKAFIKIWKVNNTFSGNASAEDSYMKDLEVIYFKQLEAYERNNTFNLKDLLSDYLNKNNYKDEDYIRLAISSTINRSDGRTYIDAPMEYIKGSSPVISVLHNTLTNYNPISFTLHDEYEVVGGVGLSTLVGTMDQREHTYNVYVDGKHTGSFFVPKDGITIYPLKSKGKSFLIRPPYYTSNNHPLNKNSPNAYLLYRPKEIVTASWSIDNKYLNIGDNTKFKGSIVGENINKKRIVIRSLEGKTFYNGLYENFTNELDLPEGVHNIVVDVYNKENDIVYTIPSIKVSKKNMLSRIMGTIYKSNLLNVQVLKDTNRFFEDNAANKKLVSKLKSLGKFFIIYNDVSPVLSPLLEK